jgi:hypothetical protein
VSDVRLCFAQVGGCLKKRRGAGVVDHTAAIQLLREQHQMKLNAIYNQYELDKAAIQRRREKIQGELAKLGTARRHTRSSSSIEIFFAQMFALNQ